MQYTCIMTSYEKAQDIVVYSFVGSWCAFVVSSELNNLFCRYSLVNDYTVLRCRKAKYSHLFMGTMTLGGAIIGGLFVHFGKRPLLLSA